MNEVMSEAATWKEAILIYLDNAYSRGELLSAVVPEIKATVAGTELESMDWSVDLIVDEWKADRGII